MESELDFSQLLLSVDYWLIIKSLWPLWAALGLLFAFQLFVFWLKVVRLRKAGMPEIDEMSGVEFEEFLFHTFKRMGYKVRHVGNSRGDYGGDLVIEKDGVSSLVQAKRYKTNVGIKAVQEVVAGLNSYKCTRAMVVTNSYFTKAAKKLAYDNQVVLWNRKKLTNELLRIQHKR